MIISMIQERVVYTFVPNKSLGQLLGISNITVVLLKTFNSGFSYIEVSLLIKV